MASKIEQIGSFSKVSNADPIKDANHGCLPGDPKAPQPPQRGVDKNIVFEEASGEGFLHKG